MSEAESQFEAMVDLTGPIDKAASAADQMKAAYKKYREIVGDATGLIQCENCREMYSEDDNTKDSCAWCSRHHKGIYLTDYSSNFWHDWHEGKPPRESAYWKELHGGEGGHKWTGCGCTSNLDECERFDRHKPEGYPPSDDDWEEPESRELSDDEFDTARSEKTGKKLLVRNYKAKLGYRIKNWQEKNKGK